MPYTIEFQRLPHGHTNVAHGLVGSGPEPENIKMIAGKRVDKYAEA